MFNCTLRAQYDAFYPKAKLWEYKGELTRKAKKLVKLGTMLGMSFAKEVLSKALRSK